MYAACARALHIALFTNVKFRWHTMPWTWSFRFSAAVEGWPAKGDLNVKRFSFYERKSSLYWPAASEENQCNLRAFSERCAHFFHLEKFKSFHQTNPPRQDKWISVLRANSRWPFSWIRRVESEVFRRTTRFRLTKPEWSMKINFACTNRGRPGDLQPLLTCCPCRVHRTSTSRSKCILHFLPVYKAIQFTFALPVWCAVLTV